MSDIDQIIANGAKTNANFDFGKINESYWKGRDEFYKQDARDTFRDGVPLDGNGQPDFGAISKTFFQKGDINNGLAAAQLGIKQQSLQDDANFFRPGGSPQSSNLPPSPNRMASTPVAPPLNRGGTTPTGAPPQNEPQGASQPAQGGTTVMQVLAAQGIPNSELQNASASVARQLGLADPNAPINMQDPQVRNVLVPAVQQLKRMGIGQIAQPGQPQQQNIPPVMDQGGGPQGAPQAPPQAAPEPAANPFANAQSQGLIPPGIDPERYVGGLKLRAALSANPQTQKLALQQLDAINKASAQDKEGESKAQQSILTDVVLPELKTSKEVASAAKTEIQSIHKAREQLDAPGGIFSGSKAEIRLNVAKIADLVFGIPNTDKIANTETFVSAMASKVAASLKALGTNPSNKDLVFSQKMAGGPELSEPALRRILDIQEQVARDRIGKHNSTVDEYASTTEAVKPYSKAFRVQAPGNYERQSAPASAAPAAGQFQTFGSPNDVRAAISAGKLKSGDTFQDSNGKTRVVP